MNFPLIEGIAYFIAPEYTARVFDIDYGGNSGLTIYSKHGGDNQRFIITLIEDEYFTITEKRTMKVLDAGNGESGTQIMIRDFTGSPSQLWKLKEAQNGCYEICSKLDENYCIDIPYQSKTRGTKRNKQKIFR